MVRRAGCVLDGFGNYDIAVTDSAELVFALVPDDVAPGDVNYAPLSLRVLGSQNATIAVTNVTNSNDALDDHLTYTIYSGLTPSQCNATGVASGGASTAYTGAMGAGGTTVTEVTAPQASVTAAGTPLCIAVTALDTQDLPQAETTTIEWQFTGTSVSGT